MSNQLTPEGLPRISTLSSIFEPKISYYFERKKWQISYKDSRDNYFHYGFNQYYWEADTLTEAVQKCVEYFQITDPTTYYEFQA